MILFLQNAWSPVYAGGEWPRPSWLNALRRCRSGQRLRLLIDDPNICYNTTPIVGATACSVVKPDPEHIKRILDEHEPDVVIACGKQAQTALTKAWQGNLLLLPHPVARTSIKKIYARGRELLTDGFDGRRILSLDDSVVVEQSA